jgi:recombination protein RecR
MYSPSINKLITELKKLPSVGLHTAERFVFYWLKSGKKDVTELMLALKELIETVKSCEVCWNFDDQSPCAICRDPKRDRSTICVVEQVPDLAAIEQTHEYQGVYHVLRGLVDAGDETSLDKMKIKELFQRVKAGNHGTAIQELILALNPDLSGETTIMYLEKELKKINPQLKVTRLARGLPMGSDLQYADEITLSNALKNRV